MTDDPRQILAEAGVECRELLDWYADDPSDIPPEDPNEQLEADFVVILALSRLVAKYASEDRIHVADDPEVDRLISTRPVTLIFESDAWLPDYPVELVVDSPHSVAQSVAEQPCAALGGQHGSGTNDAEDGNRTPES